MNPVYFIPIFCLAGIAAILLAGAFRGSLNIKARTVGDGQYGTARWATGNEIRQMYRIIPYCPKLWRQGQELPHELEGIAVLGYLGHPGKVKARVDTSDSHTMVISTTGGGKTTFFLYPNLELLCACGHSFLVTDTKGDIYRDYAGIAKEYYGYTPYIIDLRNPTRSHSFNMIYLVNKYMDLYQSTGNLSHKSRAERYAKITAKTIVHLDGFSGGGQNAFFYDAAEGLIAATILLVSEFCANGQRHIVSVFKLVQEMLAITPVVKGQPPKNAYHKLIDLLPLEHKARWLSGAALNTAEQSMNSVMGTAMSRLLSFIDSELEQILCFDSDVDAEQFCNGRTAVFIVFPEEDKTKHFLVSLFVTQLYNECITVANEGGKNHLDTPVHFLLDEYGTLPKFDGAEGMYSAGRSRKIFLCPLLQSLAQLDKNYGKDGQKIIVDCCQNVIFGGLSPLSSCAEDLSRALGNQTVQSGSYSRNGGGPSERTGSQSYQMIQRPLMTADEIKSMPQNQWIVMRTRSHPLKTTIQRYEKWGIDLDKPYTLPENATREVQYASKASLFESVGQAFCANRQTTSQVNSKPQSIKKVVIDQDLL